MRSEGPTHLPGPGHLGWWASVALLIALVLHVLAFFALGRIKVALGFEDAEMLRTRTIQLERVEILPPQMDDLALEPQPAEIKDTASLLEEIDLLAQLPEDHELEINPQVVDPEFAIQPQQPVAEGLPEALDFDTALDFDFESETAGLGRTHDPLPPAAEGQIVVDPGEVNAEDPALDAFTEEILRKGLEAGSATGQIDGVVTLDDLVGLPENVLVGKKTMLPSDLLFEYNSAELRESARVGLMKLALLVERNPGLYCWIEGHTDLFGGDAYNLDLSKRRAAAVKSYLTSSLGLPGEKIVTRGYGKALPIIRAGDVEAQAPNRRVEIKMRRTLPPEEPAVEEPPPAAVPRAIPVEEPPPREPDPTPVVEEPEPAPPKAVPVVEDAPRAVPRALPVEEPDPAPPRAVPVE